MAARWTIGPLDVKDAFVETATTQYIPINCDQIPEAQKAYFQCVPTVLSTAQEEYHRDSVLAFMKMKDAYYQLLKIGIWVMMWDFTRILFLLLPIIVNTVLLDWGSGVGKRRGKPQSTLGCLPPEQECGSFLGWPMIDWMVMTSGWGRSQGDSRWSLGAFIAPSQASLFH